MPTCWHEGNRAGAQLQMLEWLTLALPAAYESKAVFLESHVFSYSQVRIGVENLKRRAHAIRFPHAEGECRFDSLALAQAEQNGDALHAAEVGHAVFSGFLSKIPKRC